MSTVAIVIIVISAIILVTAIVVLSVVAYQGWNRSVQKIVENNVVAYSIVNNPKSIEIGVVNNATLVTDLQVTTALDAIQKQVIDDFEPYWDITCVMTFYSNVNDIPSDNWKLIVADNSDVPGALGYHSVDAEGKPIGYVFIQDAINSGYNWTVTFSHEILEMCGDPYANLNVFIQDSNTHGYIIWYENCDPVQNDTYLIDGVEVSNFILPNYFGTFSSAAPYDFLGLVTTPLQVRPGGYLAFFEVTNGNGWQIATAKLDTKTQQTQLVASTVQELESSGIVVCDRVKKLIELNQSPMEPSMKTIKSYAKIPKIGTFQGKFCNQNRFTIKHNL